MITHDFSLTKRQTRFVKTCWICNEEHEIFVDTNDFIEWQEGKYIQNVWPHLNADDREVMISGTCGPCYDKMFGDEDEAF